MNRVYFSLGSNVGDREANLAEAVRRLDPLRVSPVYETEPVGSVPQAWFLNLVAEADTALFPMQLLSHIRRIERDLGRVRVTPKGPRTIDIDILFYGKSVIRTERLEVPHPRMGERRFVLAPLADLVPDLRHPVIGRRVREMLAALPDKPIVRRR